MSKAAKTSTSQKWLIGCSIGCIAILLAVLGAGMAGYYFVRKAVEHVDRLQLDSSALLARHGRPRDYTPAPDGAIRPERLETFLALREAMAPTRAELEVTLDALGGDEDTGSPVGALGKIRSGLGMIPRIFDFFSAQNKALLEAGMGSGEYLYLYSTVYHAWLGKPLTDGPPFHLVTDDDGAHVSTGSVTERRRAETLDYLQPLLLRMLRNQLEAIPQGEADESLAEWRETLSNEIDALRRDDERMPWRDGLPDLLEDSLEPYRDRLEASYSRLCNPLETGLRGGD